jgi:hypothetical protein
MLNDKIQIPIDRIQDSELRIQIPAIPCYFLIFLADPCHNYVLISVSNILIRSRRFSSGFHSWRKARGSELPFA